MDEFSTLIEEWYAVNRRDLPWRDTHDPYRIWISEIILQQTRVAQGHDYYCRFITRFPDVETLASADEDEVMKYWQGLGYYSRARNLHAASKMIVESGHFPTTYKEIKELKGVGDYTAAAIASFAFNLPYAVVDGNVFRILSRRFGISDPIDTTNGKKFFVALAENLLDKKNPGLYNQAVMDFGAIQCTPTSPHCETCPFINSCVAYHQHTIDMLPVKQNTVKVRDRYFVYLVVRSGNDVFLRKRVSKDIWQYLYEFPLLEYDREVSEAELLSSQKFFSLFGGQKVESFRLISKKTKHILSHQVIWTDFYELNLADQTFQMNGYKRVRVEDLYKFPVSRLISRFFSLILKPNKD